MVKLSLFLSTLGCAFLLSAVEFTDSFDGDLHWKPRFRSQLQIMKTGAEDKPEQYLVIELDSHIYNGCGVELLEPLTLEKGKEYIWSFSVRNQERIPLAASPDGQKWHPLGGNPQIWKRHQIRFIAGESPATLTIGANSPKKGKSGSWQLDDVSLREFSIGNERILSLDNAPRSLRSGDTITISPTGEFAPKAGWMLELRRGLDGNASALPLETLTVKEPNAPQKFTTPLQPGNYLVRILDTAGTVQKIANFGVMPEKEAVIGMMVTDPEIAGAAQNRFRSYEAKNLRRLIDDYRSVGINLFAVTNIWSWYQPGDGPPNFLLADRVAEICRELGVTYQLKIQQWSLPKEFHGFTRVKFQNGVEGRSLSLWDERMVDAYIRLWEQAAERFAGDTALFSYAPTFGLEENSVGNDYGGVRNGMADYSAPAAAAWKEYLQNRFSDTEIAELYRGAPGEMPLPLPAVHGADPQYRPLWAAFLRFRFDRISEIYDRLFSAIRKKDPDTRITFKFGKLFPVEVECGPAGSNGYDFESIFKLAKKHRVAPAYTIIEEPVNTAMMLGFSELYGVPLWAEGGDYPESGVSPEELKSSWRQGTGLRRTLGESRSMAVNAFLNALACGIDGLEIPYYPTANPKEIWAALAAQMAISKEFRPVPGSAYLGYLPERMWGAQFKEGRASDLEVIYSDFSERVRRRLRTGFPFKIITAETLSRLPADAIIFDPGTMDMTAETAEALRRFVLDGGTLICNRHTAARGSGKGVVEKLLGTAMTLVEPTGKNLLSSGGLPIRNQALTGFRLTPEKSVLNAGEVAVTFVTRAGKGRVAFNGVPFSHHPELEPELSAAVNEPRIAWHSSLRAESRMMENAQGDILLIVSNREDEVLDGFLNLPPALRDRDCLDRVSDEAVAMSDGRIPCRIEAGMFRIFLFRTR